MRTPRAASPAPRDIGRRRLLQVGAAGLATCPFVLVGQGVGSATRNSRITELSLPFGCSLRVVQLLSPCPEEH